MNENWAGHKILEIYNKTIFGPMRADIFRYCVIYDRGGYYFDISKGCSVPIRSLHDVDTTALISYEENVCLLLPDSSLKQLMLHPTNYVLQWGFGFERGHKVLEEQINSIVANSHLFVGRQFNNPKDAILAFTGPGMFTRSVRNFLLSNSLTGVVQAGIDFNGCGIFSLPGSEARYLQVPPYATVRNSKILMESIG
jgi:mannosyltransferase OCH1-like enzyme